MLDLDAIAAEMKSAQDEVRQIAPLTERASGFDTAAAYEVARLIHEARVRDGMRRIGRKIGFTNRSIWSEYGVYQPIWGNVYDTTLVQLRDARGACRLGRLTEPRIEPEIMLHFRSSPPLTDDPTAILACIDWIAHGLEIVQSHFPGWKFAVADTIADNALHGTLLVGEPTRVEQLGADVAAVIAQLERFSVALACDGEVRDRGRGANVLDGPLAALAHLIAVLAQQRLMPPLQAGELVSTGTLTRAFPVCPGETWSTALDGIDLPGVTVTFEA
jgi:2-oxo-3-hexenedioate decarboxylase